MDSRSAASNRKPISKSLRFKIFTRDGFICQYCGRKPPEVILEIDHRVPVSQGGGNEELNLLTGCRDCNLGKSNRMPGEAAPSPDAELTALCLAQEAAEYEAFLARQSQAYSALRSVCELLERRFMQVSGSKWCPNEAALQRWVRQFGPDVCMEAINRSESAFQTGKIGAFNQTSTDLAIRYISGIMWRLKEGNWRPPTAKSSPHLTPMESRRFEGDSAYTEILVEDALDHYIRWGLDASMGDRCAQLDEVAE